MCRVMGAWARESRSCQCTMGADCRIVSTNPHLKNVIDSMRRMQMACRCTGRVEAFAPSGLLERQRASRGPRQIEAIQPPPSREKFTYPDTTRGVTQPRRALGWLKPTLKIRHFVGVAARSPQARPELLSACDAASKPGAQTSVSSLPPRIRSSFWASARVASTPKTFRRRSGRVTTTLRANEHGPQRLVWLSLRSYLPRGKGTRRRWLRSGTLWLTTDEEARTPRCGRGS